MSSINRVRSLTGFLVLITVLGSARAGAPAPPPPRRCDNDRLVTKLGERFTPDANKRFDAVRRVLRFEHLGARYVRVRIRCNDRASRWHLTVRDKSRRAVQVLTAADFPEGVPERWTTRVAGATVFLDLETPEGSTDPDLSFPEYIAMPDAPAAAYYSLQGDRPTFVSLDESAVDDRAKRLGDYVGMLLASSDGGVWAGSGVLVAKDLFLTNWHCGALPGKAVDGGWVETPDAMYWLPMVWRRMIIDFSFDGDQVSREYICTGIVASCKSLDYALLSVAPLDPESEARSASIRLSPVRADEPIMLLHHPAGMKKQLSAGRVRDAAFRNWVDTGSRTDFTHDCDTEAGSSGAPVFDDDGRLVGLHHLGFLYDRSTCAPRDRVNKAVRIDKIAEHLREAPGVAARIRLVP